jgi:hypothetical protein
MAVGIPRYTRFELDQLLPNWECWLPASQVSFLETYFEYDGDLEAIHLHTGIVMPRLHETLRTIQQQIERRLLVKNLWYGRRQRDPCRWPGCTKVSSAHRLCSAHYFTCKRHFEAYTLAKKRRHEKETQRRRRAKVITPADDLCNVWPN